MTRLRCTVLTAVFAALLATPAAAVTPPPGELPLRNTDVRLADGGPVSASEHRARETLEDSLGDEGVVSTDRISGGARLVARTDGVLTGPRRDSPADVALGYVRARREIFGLGAAELDGLRVTGRYRSPDGVTHLAYVQTHLGVAAYDNVLLANVADDGRLLNVGGSAVSGLAVSSVAPDLAAAAALLLAKQEVGGRLIAPHARQGRGPERPTQFADGDTARLTLFGDGMTTRLAWRLAVTGEHGYRYEVVVDATRGSVLKRRSLTEFASEASVYRNFPGAASGGAPVVVDLAGDPAWLNRSAGATRLSGNNVHAYVDADNTDGHSAGDLEVPASGQTNWLYPLTPFAVAGQSCPSPGCTWNSGDAATRTTNHNQATTQLFYLVNSFHDHLAAAPISFTAAAGNFEHVDSGPGIGGDPVMAESDNYSNPNPPASISTNNARMTTSPDGTSPRLQMFLFTNPSVNASDTADVVYHEYAHGLTSRSVGSGIGLDANQSRAMGEGWSDWYALDFLEAEGLRPDAPATDGEMTIGGYLVAAGFRTQGADCPVGSPDPACPGKRGAHQGGYTLADIGTVRSTGFQVHDDGEIWLETLWDLRSRLGSAVARRLVTSGLRLAPNNPSFLEARDAILLADRNAGAANYDALWSVFAARGMGSSATTTSSSATTATAAFDVPQRLVHESTTVSDAAPGGDGDDVAEPGETVAITEQLANPQGPVVTNISGVLSTTSPFVAVTQPDSGWPAIGTGLTQGNSPPFRVAIPSSASCDTSVQLSLAMTMTGASFSLPLELALGSKLSADVPRTIPATGMQSTLTFGGTGTVDGLKVRIGKLTHTWVGDIVVTLTSPAGTTVTLIDRPGAGNQGAGGDDLVDVVLEDGAAAAIEDIPAVNPPGGYTGSFRPEQPLSAFDGEDRQGVWTLRVSDEFPSDDSGTLRAWGLRPSNAGCSNSAPVAVDDSYGATGGQTLTASSVLANDTDADRDALSAVKVSDPAHGRVSLAPDGTFTYTSDAGYRGQDSFTYRAHDGTVASPTAASVRIAVANNAPVAVEDSYAVAAGAALDAPSVLANDSDPNGDALSAAVASAPEHGALALAPDGTFTYTPGVGFSGRDSFTYRASDGTDSSAPATATITVARQPAPPPAPPPPSPPAKRSPAKLEVLRAGLTGGSLDVLARMTSRASGRVVVRYRSSGRTTSFSVPVTGGSIRFRRSLPASRRSTPTGIFTLRYDGSTLVAPDSVTLRAAAGKALLVRRTALIDPQGRLRVSGTINRLARGVVRVRLAYTDPGGQTAFEDYRAAIVNGSWSLTQPLPRAAAAAGGQLSIQFTGYEPRRIRGEQLAKAVRSPG